MRISDWSSDVRSSDLSLREQSPDRIRRLGSRRLPGAPAGQLPHPRRDHGRKLMVAGLPSVIDAEGRLLPPVKVQACPHPFTAEHLRVEVPAGVPAAEIPDIVETGPERKDVG